MAEPLRPAPRKCKAHTSGAKRPCKNFAMLGGVVCDRHGGRAPQVRNKAAQRVRDMLAEAIDPDRVLREAGRIAYSDIRQLFDEKGKLLPITEWPDDISRAIAQVEVVRGNVDQGDGKFDEVVKFRLWDKVSKLTNLMKYHGQLTEKVEVSGNVNVVERLLAGRKRVANAKR